MASTIIEVCNSAITKVGGQSILSIDDNTTEARICKLRFAPCRKIVIRRHPWNFAIDRVVTAPEVGSPAFGYTYKHPFPATLLRVLEVGCDVPYRIEGRYILADSDSLDLKYLKDVEDPTTWDELFGEALACYLAWDIAYKITQKQGVREELWQAYKDTLRDAKSVDAQEERDHEIEANLLVDSRFDGTSPGRSNR